MDHSVDFQEFYEPILPSGWNPVENRDDPLIWADAETRRFAALVAPFGSCLEGFTGGDSDCFLAPRSPSQYQWAHSNGGVSVIPMNLQHAPVRGISASAVVDYYAHTGAAVASVKYYDLDDGVYAFGRLFDDVDDAIIDKLRFLALSGDWRYTRYGESSNRTWDMLASQVVSVPGFRRLPSAKCAFSLVRSVTASASADGDAAMFGAYGYSAASDSDLAAVASAYQFTDKRRMVLAILDKVSNDYRVLSSADITVPVGPVPLVVDHDEILGAVVGSVSDVDVAESEPGSGVLALWGDVAFFADDPIAERAERLVESEVAGFSIAAGGPGLSVHWDWDDNLVFDRWSLATVAVVVNPAFSETYINGGKRRPLARASFVDENGTVWVRDSSGTLHLFHSFDQD